MIIFRALKEKEEQLKQRRRLSRKNNNQENIVGAEVILNADTLIKYLPKPIFLLKFLCTNSKI